MFEELFGKASDVVYHTIAPYAVERQLTEPRRGPRGGAAAAGPRPPGGGGTGRRPCEPSAHALLGRNRAPGRR